LLIPQLVQHFIPIPSETNPTLGSHLIHAATNIVSPTAPWVVFANGLLTNLTMWNYVIPYFIQAGYNVLVHSQRGHGKSTLPDPSPSKRQTTIPSQAYDIAHLIHALQISPIHSVIGVSQGGATALAFSALPAFFPSTSLPSPLPTTKSIIACASSARTAAGNKAAWEERASLAYGIKISFDDPSTTLDDEYATHIGMSRLAAITVPRWFPPGSALSPASPSGASGLERAAWVSSLVTHTPPRGFLAGAQALAEYDLLSESDLEKGILGSAFNNPDAPQVLLLAGALDGGGKVARGFRGLAERWAEVRPGVQYTEMEGLGHIPMIEQPEEWWKVVGDFLQKL
jgi:pimeloyl-ACP methyl ester carboxylesterase